MRAIMIVYMNLTDEAWMESYFAQVPRLLAEYGATPLAGSRTIRRLEGDTPAPDRMAVISFPSIEAIDRFMADDRYQSHLRMRQAGSTSQIFVFTDEVVGDSLV